MLSPQIIFVILIIAFLVFALYRDLLRPVLIFFIVVVSLFAARIIDSKDVLSGFANEQLVVVLILLVLSDVIQKTGLLDLVLKNIFTPSLSYKGFLSRMLPGIAGISAFVNNTPLVAIMIPHVYGWAKKVNIPPSKVLIPLSYATILGGTITLIGTSTNLVVNGFAVDAGFESLKMFDFALVGIPASILGILFMIFLGPKLLPDRKDLLSDFSQKSREYLVEVQVPDQSSHKGKTIESAGLRNLRGLFLTEIIRMEQKITPVSPKEIIQTDDILIFAGATETIIDLLNSPKDFIIPKHSSMFNDDGAEIVEIVISAESPLIGKTIKEAHFRAKYDAAVVAVNRNGERLSGKIGDMKIQGGDLLLIVTGKDFIPRSEESNDFYLVSKIREIRNFPKSKLWILAIGIVTAFLLPAVGILTLFQTLLMLMCLIVVMKVVKLGEIKKGLDIELFVILALSLALGKAITKSGANELFADSMITLFGPFNSGIAILAGIYLITNILAMLVTNKAAVAITFPIAMAAAAKLGLDPKPFILAVALAGCAEFMTPYGYQTNLMVYGPGGYKFKDYIRIGWGISLVFMITTVSILGYIYNLY